jgi:hypothetical protein
MKENEEEKLSNIELNIAIVFRGKVEVLRTIEEVLAKAGAYPIYRKKSFRKLYIKEEEGKFNDYDS